MTTFTLTTKKAAIVSIEISEEQSFAFVNAEIRKLQDKLDELNGLDFLESGELAVNSLKTKVNKLEADGKLEAAYTYEELKKRTSGASFTAYLSDMGIEKSLHGSATRALALGKATLAGLKLAGIEDKAVLKAVAENAIGGKKAAWRQAVLDWLLQGNTETEEAETE